MKRQLSEDDAAAPLPDAKKPRPDDAEPTAPPEAAAPLPAPEAEAEAEPAAKALPTGTVRYKWCISTAGGYEGRTIREVIPVVAVAFLDLVDPSISITAAKHDYWETDWSDLRHNAWGSLKVKADDEDVVNPATWRSQLLIGEGHWRDAVSDNSGWTAYAYFLAHYYDADTEARDKATLALWNHDAEMDAYAERCAARRARVVTPLAVGLLRAAKPAVGSQAIDLAPFQKAFPGCPFGTGPGASWTMANVLHEYYGLRRPNGLPQGDLMKPHRGPFAHYADHFEGKADWSDYSYYYYGDRKMREADGEAVADSDDE